MAATRYRIQDDTTQFETRDTELASEASKRGATVTAVTERDA